MSSAPWPKQEGKARRLRCPRIHLPLPRKSQPRGKGLLSVGAAEPAEGAQQGSCDSLYQSSLLQNSKEAQICSEHDRRQEMGRSSLLLVLQGISDTAVNFSDPISPPADSGHPYITPGIKPDRFDQERQGCNSL